MENIVRQGEIAYKKQFLLFSQCFLPFMALIFHFNTFPNKPWFLRVCRISLLKTLGKGEIARHEQFLLFPQCFLPIWRTFCHFHYI